MSGDDAAANRYFDQAFDLDPGYRPALDYRLAAFKKAGDDAAARSLLEAFVRRHNPYDGLAALELAQALATSEQERRVTLAQRAIRFGAGSGALEFLKSIDPEAAAEYEDPKAKTAAAPSDDGGSD